MTTGWYCVSGFDTQLHAWNHLGLARIPLTTQLSEQIFHEITSFHQPI
jgi:hypothetical protein